MTQLSSSDGKSEDQQAALVELVQREGVHFLDFGCSSGGSLKRFSSLYGGKAVGLGLDMDPAKVDAAVAAGFKAVVFDINKLSGSKLKVNFVSMSHFLEHLPGMREAAKALQLACHVARDFIVVVQPSFDADGLLLRSKLKPYWSDWSGHPNRMTTLEFHNVLHPLAQKGSISGFRIYGRDRILDYADPRLVPIEFPTNSQKRLARNDAALAGVGQFSTESTAIIPFPVYAETVVIVKKRECPFDWLEKKLGALDMLIDY